MNALRPLLRRRTALLLSAVLLSAACSGNSSAGRETVKTEHIVTKLPVLTVAAAENYTNYRLEEAVHPGDTLYGVLQRLQIKDAAFTVVIDREKIDSKTQKLRAGQTVSVRLDASGTATDIRYFTDNDDGERELVAVEKINGSWRASSTPPILETMPALRSVVVRTSAQGSLAQAGVGLELRESLRDIFSEHFKLDDLQEGDQIRLVYSVMYFHGLETGAGDILEVEIVKGGQTYRAYFYDRGDEGGSYYDADGKPMKKTGGFNIRPVEYTRISSPYGIRVHPILGTVRMHTGIDYAAPTGTPVYAPADGNLTFKGWKGGYGHTVMLMHDNGVETLYGHLSAFSTASGRVKAGEVIGFVGTSGRSTGPHLHYEARINGQHVNPAAVALPTHDMEPVNMAEFRRQQEKADKMMAVIRGLPPVTVDQTD